VHTKRADGPRAGLNVWVRVKVKFTLVEDTKAETGSTGIAVLLSSAPERVGGQRHAPAALTPGNAWEKGGVFVPFGNRTSILQLSSPAAFVTTVTELSSECTIFPQNFTSCISVSARPEANVEKGRWGNITKMYFRKPKKRDNSDKIIQIMNTISMFNQLSNET
jgi:hypothetical protein